MSSLFRRIPAAFPLLFALSWVSPQLVSTPSQADDFSELIVFGDSLSDSGNWDQDGLASLISAFAGYGPKGSFSNGYVWHEHLADSLPIARAAPSNADGGNNFAWGGAKTDRSGELNGFWADFFLGQQTGIQEQVEIYLDDQGSAGADPDALYIVWGGGNDLLGASSSSAVDVAIANMDDHFRDLAAAGATTFLAPNLPNMGLIPRSLNAGQATSDLRETLSINFNSQLDAVLDQLELDFPVEVHRLDVFDILTEIIDNPGEFGFSNTTGTCPVPDSACAGYVFWDDIHPTEAAHQLIGQAALELITAPLLGDLSGDGHITTADINPFVLALTNRAAYAQQHPGLDPEILGDLNGDGTFNLGDVAAFKSLVASQPAVAYSQAVPEPTTLGLLTLSLTLLISPTRRR